MALDGTNQYNVGNTTVPSPCKSPGTDKCAIAEMRGPIRTLGQSSQPGDNGANDLSSLIEQNTLLAGRESRQPLRWRAQER